MATVDDKKIIFSMVGVSKIIPQNQKQILKNIYLSFFYGAKIGIIGLNGAGKSTLLKIIAGLVEPTQGEVVWSPGYSVGYLPQDPPLDEAKTVKENVMEGVQHIYDALKEYDDINVKFGLEEYYSDADKMDKLMQRQAELQDIIDATDAWNIDSRLERAMDALRCPKGDLPVTNLSGGDAAVLHSAVCSFRSQTYCCSMSLPTTLMLRVSTGWSSICSSMRVRSSLLPTTVTSSTM